MLHSILLGPFIPKGPKISPCFLLLIKIIDRELLVLAHNNLYEASIKTWRREEPPVTTLLFPYKAHYTNNH